MKKINQLFVILISVGILTSCQSLSSEDKNSEQIIKINKKLPIGCEISNLGRLDSSWVYVAICDGRLVNVVLK